MHGTTIPIEQNLRARPFSCGIISQDPVVLVKPAVCLSTFTFALATAQVVESPMRAFLADLTGFEVMAAWDWGLALGMCGKVGREGMDLCFWIFREWDWREFELVMRIFSGGAGVAGII